MSSLFAFLFLLAAVALIVGLIRPSAFQKIFQQHTNRKTVGISLGALTLLLFITVGVTAGPLPKTPTSTLLSNPAQAAAKVVTNTKSTKKAAAPVITTKTMTTTTPIPFTSTTQQDASLAKGKTTIKTAGVNGVQTQTWKVTYSNGNETGRTVISTAITTQPVTEVIEQGTYVAPAPTKATTPTPAAPATPSCYPLSDEGTCYEPGEYCRDSDAGTSGVAGDGKAITCTDNDGLRWEPS